MDAATPAPLGPDPFVYAEVTESAGPPPAYFNAQGSGEGLSAGELFRGHGAEGGMAGLRLRLLVTAGLLLVPAAASANSLDVAHLKDTIRAMGPDLRRCWEAALARNPKLPEGRVVTVFRIEKSGEVSTAQTTENETGDEIFAACTRGVFKLTPFGERPEPVNITYPLVFRRAQ